MANGTTLLEAGPKLDPSRLLSELEPGVPVYLSGVSWGDYLAISDCFGERRIRTCYNDGEMEIIMPSIEHEDWAVIIGRLIVVLTQELHMPIKDGRMVTCRPPGENKGLESDNCYWFESERLLRGIKRLDLSVVPPPDLSLEIEVTRGAEAKLQVYAALRVPEVWRFDGEELTVHQLAPTGEYIVAERSRHFPFLSLKEFVRFVLLVDQMEQNALEQTFRDWVRQQIATGWKTEHSS